VRRGSDGRRAERGFLQRPVVIRTSPARFMKRTAGRLRSRRQIVRNLHEAFEAAPWEGMVIAMKDKVPGSTAPASQGFRANLTANLTDLVQMECLARSTHVIRVMSHGDVGYLYFQGGEIVHAMSSSAVGEAAALEILTWEEGSFEPSSAGWSSSPTITRSWQSLLMLAATTRDEAERDKNRRRNVVDFPREKTASTPMPDKPPPTLSSSYPKAQPPSTIPAPASSQPAGPAQRGIERAVRLDPGGKVVSTRGDCDELAATTAYATRLAGLVGDQLGLDALKVIECVSGGTRRLFYPEKGGSVIGLEVPEDVDLSALREKLGL
jgi:hypothetical protein